MNVEIAQRLAARRKQAGLSQEALAEKLGVSRQAVSKWERSESSPDTDNLIALAQLYGVSLDDLLYVDASIADDVAFEAADRAAERETEEVAKTEVGVETEAESKAKDEVQAETDAAAANTAEVVEAEILEETVDAENESSSEDRSAAQEQDAARSDAPSGFNFAKEGKGKVHVGFDGIHVEDGQDSVHVSWAEGVHVVDRSGEEVHVGWDGVHIKSQKGPDPDQFFKRGKRHRNHHDYDFDHGPITPFARNWLRFPFWALVIIAYLLAGVIQGFWVQGLFFFLAIPLYYALGPAIEHKRFAPFLGVLYPVLAIGWFCWMAFIENQPHPAWAIFLTIPVVEVCIVAFSKWWRGRKQ